MSIPPPPGGAVLDDDEDGLPPPPPGATLDAASKPRVGQNTPSLGMDSLARAMDGDTLQTGSGRSVRLWGIDAPEVRQPGWDRTGRSVPIGLLSRNSLAQGLLGSTSRIGQPVGQSYGRTVAPVTLGDMDAGLMMARKGQALVAPEYLRSDQPRLNSYMDAERLARLNGLGMHDTFHQTPQEHRRNPDYVPERETVARFWDTPTPFAGLRPEIEAGYLDVTRTGTADEILAYAQANGFTINPDETRRFVADRDKGASVDWQIGYKDMPKPLTNLGDGRTGATVRGIGDGILAGGLDEAGAALDALGLTPDRENVWNSDRRLADIWSNNQQQNSAILGYDDLAHPGYRLGGQIAGGLVVPFGAKAHTVPQLFRVGAAYGGAEGFLGTDGDVPQRLTGAAIGVPLGGAVGAVGGKALELGLRAAPGIASRLRGNALDPRNELPDGPAGSIPPLSSRYEIEDDLPLNGVSDAHSYSDGLSTASVPLPPPGAKLDLISMDVEQWPSVTSRQRDYLDMGPVRPGRMDQPLTNAQRQAMAQGIDPRDVLPIPSNQIGSLEEAAAIDAGRFAPATAPDERVALSSRGVKAQTGTVLPKRGPLDLVTWLRSQGGVKDQGGNLRAMGIGNDGRDMDFARGEQRFGPLLSDQGMNLDDAALRAWEMGYLPGTERPDVNALLDAIDRTHSGSERFYLPDDLPEVERFEGMRADRQALEQMQANGPVFEDRSILADEQPFPPVEAYEEWPAGGPDFAGNINLSKLESPQDISRALDMTQRRVGFDAATRGRISHAETERLASDLGVTPERLLTRRRGVAFNAEEALAARQLLAKSGSELVNAAKKISTLDDPGDELLADFRQKWVRHVAIQEQVSGMTAEAGRALQQFRQMADSRAIRGDVLSAMVKGGGGRDGLKDAATVLLDAVETEPGKFNALATKAMQPKWRNRLSELYINFLLSNPATHTVNTVSNTLTAIAQIPEHAVAGALGKARQVFPGANIDRVTSTELGQRTFGLLQGAKEGVRAFATALRTGEPSDFVSKVEGQEYKAIPGKLGTAIRMPTRLLTAEDELFKGIARRMELNGLAARQAHVEGLKGEAAAQRIAELVDDPSDAMLARADEYGRYLTFQTRLEGLPQSISLASNQNIVAKVFLPFVRTPTNLLKFAAERSPAAPLLKSWKEDIRAGGARRDLAIAKSVVGTGMGMLFYQAAKDGLITGSAPSDPAKSRLLYADGWQPYSIKVGDKYYSFKRIDPFAMTLGVAADLATLPEGMSERQQDEGITLLVASILGNMASKTWLTGVSDIVGALYEPDRNADRMVQRVIGSFLVPAGVAGLARTIDPTAREIETVGDALQARIPFASKGLLPRRDLWGEPIVNEGGVGPDIVSPVYQSTMRNDPVNREMLALGYAPGKPGRSVGGEELSPQAYDRYQQLAGQKSHAALDRLVASPAWRAMDAENRRSEAEKAVREARKQARDALFDGDNGGSPPPPPGASLDGVPPPPPGAVIDGASGGRNVYADLQAAIPGIRFTSGFRTPAYQEQMRGRGYKPAWNSGHLSGSDLDMLPPPGKSMGWLKDQVRKYDPDARLLIHDGHLHASFPGYYGAPVLGGARSAGINNPLIGMPPPPNGAVIDR